MTITPPTNSDAPNVSWLDRRGLLLDGRGGYNRWMINGKSWPDTRQLITTEEGKRYRLALTNKSGDNHLCTCIGTPSRSPRWATSRPPA
jgi:hypothetical protein